MGLVEKIREQIAPPCIHNGRINKRGCTVSLKNAPQSRLVIDCDKPGGPVDTNRERCDFLFIAEVPGQPDWVAPLELKKKNLDASKVVEQLRAGARATEKLICDKMKIDFRPTAVSLGIHKAQRNALKENRNYVRFHKHNEPVRLIKCDGPLIQVFKS